MSISSLLNRVESREIVLPAIQRDFVWPQSKITRLFDSLMRGFPVGLLLLWETYDDLRYRAFSRHYQPGSKHTFEDNKDKKRLQVVLDGQQRLQSLYLALYGSLDGKFLYFDVLSGEENDTDVQRYIFDFFTPNQVEEANAGLIARISDSDFDEDQLNGKRFWVNVPSLFGLKLAEKSQLRKKICADLALPSESEDLIEANIARLDEVLLKEKDLLKTSIVDSDLPVQSPYRKRESDVLEIFVRINRQLTPLSRSDLIFSMLKLKWTESADELPEFIESINKGNSFGFDTDFVIRCLFAVSGLGTKFDVDVLRKKRNVDAIKENFKECCAAIQSAIDFVQQHCWCFNDRLIGGVNSIVPFVYHLFHVPKHQIKIEEVVPARKAFYLFAFSRVFSRYADSRLRRFISEDLGPLALEGDTSFPLHRAISKVRYWEGVEGVDIRLLQRNYRLSLHLVQGQPGVQTHYKANLPEVDHIFPRSTLRRKGREEAEIDHIANFWILAKGINQNKSNKHPRKYFEEVPERELQRALIDRELLDFRRFRTFLTTRGDKIVDRVNSRVGFRDEDFELQP